MTRVLALDVGTSSTRARIYDGSGTVERGENAQRRYRVQLGEGGRAELDADAVVAATRAAIDEVLSPGERVDAVGGSCFWHSLVAVDGRSRAASPVLLWQDTRAADAADALARRLDAEAVHVRTGCPLHPAYWPAKIEWLRTERPDLVEPGDRLACFSSYLLERLAGEPRISLSMASGTGLLDVERGVWDEELLDALELDPARLPPLSDEPVPAERPWFPPLGDGACSNVGVGAVTPERAALTVGTSAALRAIWPEPPPPRRELFRMRLDADSFVLGGAISDGGNLRRWLAETLRLPEGELALAGREPDGHGLTFLPLLGGERSPGWRARARGAVTGLSLRTEPVDVLQAALEGVAYRLAEIAAAMPRVREVVATGGGLEDDPDWAQILADVLELPVTLSAVREGSARGAAVVALRRLGERPEPPPLGRVFEPRHERIPAYRSARDRQRALYREVT